MNVEVKKESGHLLVDLAEGRFLIDTGSPTSFARDGRVTFAGKTLDVSSSAMGMLDAGELSGYVGMELGGLIGMDILGNYCLSFAGDRLQVDEDCQPEDGYVALSTESFMNIPVVTISMSGRDVSVFVDTGAKVSYLAPTLIDEFPVEVTLHDFYPGVGEFDVNVSTASCSLSG